MISKPIIIVSGEPYSVFLEIFFKSLKVKKYKRPIVLIVSKKLFFLQMKKLGFNFKINILRKKSIDFKNLNNKKINIIDINFNFKKTFANITDKSNKYINNCFDVGLEIIKSYPGSSLINGPISKKNFLKKKYLGITEFLTKKTNKNHSVMLIYNKKLSVSPITTHLPLKLVTKSLSKNKIIMHVKIIKDFYVKQFNKNPKIAITGLNPHCESNYSSSEENNIIIPAIRYFSKKINFNVEGPFSADTVFMKDVSKDFDVIIGMYHDQVLAPLKAIHGFNAINITLGLPFIRISPDHGPNTSMLGKNLSNPKSLIEALKFLDK